MDEKTNVQFAEESGNTPLGAESPVQPANTTQPMSGWTDEQLERLVEEKTAKAFRAVQSMQAKQEERIRKEIESRMNVFAEAGVQLAPEHQQVIAQKTREQIISEYASSGDTQSPATAAPVRQDAPPSPDPVGLVNQMAQSVLQREGVSIDQADPEVSLINQATKDPLEFLESIKAAAAAKKERLARSTGPAAVPGAIGAGAAPSPLMSQYEKEKSSIPRGDVDRLFRLQLKYRQKGLQV